MVRWRIVTIDSLNKDPCWKAKMSAKDAGVIGGNGALPTQDHRSELPGRPEQAGEIGRAHPVVFEQMNERFQRR